MAIEKGTIKVVWITKDTKKIHSKMFDDINMAKDFGEKKKDYLIFRLLKHKNFNEFSWALLPHGNYKLYQNALAFYQKHRNSKLAIEKLFRL